MKKSILAMMAAALILTACEKEEEYTYEDGMYKAETAEFHFGWKAFLEVEIQEDQTTSINFDYFDEMGALKSETSDEDYPMDPHPRVWVPQLEEQLMAIDINSVTEIDGVTGATGGSSDAYDLFLLILEAAKTGDTSTQILSDTE